MSGDKIRPFSPPLRQSSVLDTCAEGLRAVQGDMTDAEIAAVFGWSESTIKNVRKRQNGLSLWLAMLAARATGGAFLAPVLALIGLRPVAIDAVCAGDGMMTRHQALGLKIARALDANGPGGKGVTVCEARGMLAELDEFQRDMDAIRAIAQQVEA